MEFFSLLIIFSSFFCFLFCGSLAALRPRGVSLPRKVFYDPSQHFHCLDGSGIFSFHYINDDFCDCEDGSDEPGTSACQNGIFSCLNHGHLPVSLPSSRVNDGICDCCDASDEYRSDADCLNNCKELGEKAYAAAKVVYDEFEKGQTLRNQYIKLGKEKKEEYQALLEELFKQEQEALKVKNEKQDEKENAETREGFILSREREFRRAQEKRIAAEKRLLLQHQQQEENEGQRAFSDLDVNGDGKLTLDEIKSFKRFDYDGDGVVSDNEAQFYMHKKDEVTLEDFLSSGWKIMKPAFTMEELEAPIQDTSTEIDQSSIIDETPPEIETKDKENILRDAADARKHYADADKLFRDIQAEIWHLKRKLQSDFGESDEFLFLENRCYEFSEKRYIYKFCPFDKTTQIVKVSKDETLIGLWDKWSGPDEDVYQQMKYSRGASCWNGPNRSAEVVLKCGIENKITSVIENSPCTYTFEFMTPASCKELSPEIKNILKNDISFL
ncbi:glucosidase 2 subunit beta [Parasteatoda tepidariorum]|uniref:glucosidase 2 subunit beta n=1 Tax=Parasteatoda tepidariorum TaxID=114398 RepID=UPI00077FB0B2|nr:glucosidase 2 subunit beta [Parasteatoda tepidariorum]